MADNPIFYEPRALTATSYRRWLDSLAVRWVALPSGQLDYAAAAESRLIRGGLDYLTVAWSSSTWTLFEVAEPVPLVSGAQLQTATASTLTMQTSGAAEVAVRLRWSPYFVVAALGSGARPAACVVNRGGWVTIVVKGAGTFVLSNRFDPAARFASSASCRI